LVALGLISGAPAVTRLRAISFSSDEAAVVKMPRQLVASYSYRSWRSSNRKTTNPLGFKDQAVTNITRRLLTPST
jgi:hypothetical protein